MKKRKFYSKITIENINEISKIFNIQHIDNSRIDGYPYFKCKSDYFITRDLKEYFDLEYVPLLGDQMPNFPAGERDHLIFKITKLKENFQKLVRKKKLIKINLSV